MIDLATGSGLVAPSGNHVIANLPPFVTRSTYIPTGSGNYEFRVYSKSSAGLFSSSFVSGVTFIEKGNPVSSIQIFNLRIGSENTGDYIVGGQKTTGSYTGVEPTFYWDVVSNQESLSTDNFGFRVTIRQPITGNTPSSVLYYQDTTNEPKWTFNFSGHFASGLHRDYDFVVESLHPSGLTSAGNHFFSSTELWTNPLGFDWMRAQNLAPSGFYLTSGNLVRGQFKTEQWINSDGGITFCFS